MRLLTHEEIISIWVGAADPEELHQVVKLPMDVSTHSDGAFLEIATVSERKGQLLDIFALTTGWTFDSSVKTSRAYEHLPSVL